MFDENTYIVASNSEKLGSYYPFRVGYLCTTCVETLETPPPDFNDSDDVDFGITGGQLTQWTPSADLALPEGSRGLFWTRYNDTVATPIPGVQHISNANPEWTTSSLLTIDDLVQHLFTDSAYQEDEKLYEATGIVPHCSNVGLEQGQNLPDECGDGSVTDDDADLDIGFIGIR